MDSDFGLLVDFLHGELAESDAARVRVRLENEDGLFATFERLRRTYAVLRSMPLVGNRESVFGNREQPSDRIPNPDSRFPENVRIEFEARGLASLIPYISARREFIGALRVEFSVRAICASLPQLVVGQSLLAALRTEFGARARAVRLPFIKARPAWIRALREEFAVRAAVCSIPLTEPRPEFVAALRAEFGQRALVGSVPAMDVRAGFERRLKVALVESQRDAAPAAPVLPAAALPVVDASDPFRRRLFKKVLLSSRRRVRDEPKRADVEEFQLGREMRAGFKQSRRSLAFTFTVHAIAIVVLLFVFVNNETNAMNPLVARGDSDSVAVPALPDGDIGLLRSRPPERIALPAATTPDWSPREADLPSGMDGVELPEQERRTLDDEPPPPDRQVGYEEVLGFMDRDGASSFFRLRGLSRQEKIDYLGSAELYDALDRTLAWLARIQQLTPEQDGSWGNPMTQRPELREVAKLEVTSAALLAFLGDGHSSERSPVSEYSFAVRRGIAWLLTCQREDGQIGSPERGNVLVHAMATLALAEEFGLTRRSDLREPLRKACRWLCAVKADGGGFPFLLNQPANMSTSVWAYMALATARNVKVPPIDLPQERIDEFHEWYRAQTRDGKPLNDSVVLGHELLADSAAAAMALFATEAELDTRAGNYFDKVSREAPNLAPPGNRERDNGDMRYLFFGSMAQALNHQRTGSKPGEWYGAFTKTLLQNQRQDGTWAVTSDYASLYGDEYTAAMACLSIENAYRVSILK